MAYKLVVSDLDGTFLNDKSEIPEKNLEAVRLMNERGVIFALASGRSYHSLDKFYDALALKGRGICGIAFNGAVTYEIDTLRQLKKVLLNNADMRRLVAEMRPFLKDIYVYDADGTLYCEHETELYSGYYTRSRVPHGIKRFDDIETDVIKILLIEDNAVVTKAYEHMKAIVPGVCNMFFSSKRMLEFTEPSATKGNALRFLSERLNIDISETIAVGDNFNDESMIRAAGLGVVTANAEEDMKMYAGYVTKADNNAGALLEVAEMFL